MHSPRVSLTLWPLCGVVATSGRCYGTWQRNRAWQCNALVRLLRHGNWASPRGSSLDAGVLFSCPRLSALVPASALQIPVVWARFTCQLNRGALYPHYLLLAVSYLAPGSGTGQRNSRAPTRLRQKTPMRPSMPLLDHGVASLQLVFCGSGRAQVGKSPTCGHGLLAGLTAAPSTHTSYGVPMLGHGLLASLIAAPSTLASLQARRLSLDSNRFRHRVPSAPDAGPVGGAIQKFSGRTRPILFVGGRATTRVRRELRKLRAHGIAP